MGAKTSSARAIKAINGDLAVSIERLNSQIQQISDTRAAAELRRSDLSSERTIVVRSARVENDLSAAARLQEIDVEIAAIDRNLADDGAVTKTLKEELAEAEREQLRAEWEADRQRLRAKLLSLQSSPNAKNIRKAVAALNKLLEEATESEREIANELVAFDRSFRENSRSISGMDSLRGDLVAWALRDAIHVDVRTFALCSSLRRDLAFDEERRQAQFGMAIEALDRLDLVFR